MFGVVVLSLKYNISSFYPTYRKINFAHCYIPDFICTVFSVLMNVKSTFQLSSLLMDLLTKNKMDIHAKSLFGINVHGKRKKGTITGFQSQFSFLTKEWLNNIFLMVTQGNEDARRTGGRPLPGTMLVSCQQHLGHTPDRPALPEPVEIWHSTPTALRSACHARAQKMRGADSGQPWRGGRGLCAAHLEHAGHGFTCVARRDAQELDTAHKEERREATASFEGLLLRPAATKTPTTGKGRGSSGDVGVPRPGVSASSNTRASVGTPTS
jgi:hypothetical protein